MYYNVYKILYNEIDSVILRAYSMEECVAPPRSFRLEENVSRNLDKIADLTNTNVSTIIRTLIRDYVEVGYFIKSHGSICISNKILREILRTMDEDKIIMAAKNTAAFAYKQRSFQLGLPYSEQGFLFYLQRVLCRYAEWAHYDQYLANNKYSIILFHDNDYKWSIFLKTYIEQSLGRINPQNRFDVSISENVVKISDTEQFEEKKYASLKHINRNIGFRNF